MLFSFILAHTKLLIEINHKGARIYKERED